MSLTREQYDGIMRGYAQIQSRHRNEQRKRREEIYRRIPAYRELDEQAPSVAVSCLRDRLTGTGTDARGSTYLEQLMAIAAQKKALLSANGYPEDYLALQYDCPLCHDTGYVDGAKCRCFKRQETAILYRQSHLEELVRWQNFSVLSEEYYQGEDLRRFRAAAAASRKFASLFGQDFRNLYFYGTVGTGKSFLSICIAKELIEAGRSVLYFSAAALFDKLSSYAFDYKVRDELRDFTQDLYTCDLLIIDDLGTELTNQFVAAQLFTCLNERFLNKKPTIISTNLSLKEMQNRYSDRVFSRITNDYDLYKLSGPDIRVMRSRQRNDIRRRNNANQQSNS